LIKDWTLWHGMAWASLVVAVPTDEPREPTGPAWIDYPLLWLFSFAIMGMGAAGVRRVIREIVDRRRSRNDADFSMQPAPTVPPRPADSTHAQRMAISTASQRVERAPISTAQMIDLQASSVLFEARENLPYPIARAARSVQLASDPLEQYQYLIDLGEALTLTLGMLSTAWLRREDPGNEALEMLHSQLRLRGVSQGHWHSVTQAAEKLMVSSAHPIPGFVDGVRSRKKDALGAVDALKRVLSERNRSAHGARPHNRAEAAHRNRDLAPDVLAAIERVTFLSATPWVLVEGLSFRRHDQLWDARLRVAMGDHPEFDLSIQVVSQPVANDTFYVLTDTGPLDLSPLLVLRFCEVCRQPEVCYADRVDDQHGVSLKSFARGHQVFDRDLVVEVDSIAAPAPAASTTDADDQPNQLPR